MDHLFPSVVAGFDLFLFVTFVGIGIYLAILYRTWRETSIGSWALGTISAATAILMHLIGIYQFNQGLPDFRFMYRLATAFFFIAAWFFGVAHPLARRGTVDTILIILLTIPMGFILPYTLNELDVSVVSGLIIEQYSTNFNTFDLLNFGFYGILYLSFARDSHLIYTASIRDQVDSYRKSVAIGHLIAWQFFAVGTAALRYIAKFVGTTVYFGLPFLLLLVPLLTIGSRPFDWAREGHEPVLLLLIDQYGTPTYSWRKESHSPLFMEGSSIATISRMLEDFVDEEVKQMEVQFEQVTLYTNHNMGYLSILITTGPHQSFQQLISKIHQILVTDVVKQAETGVPGYEFPYELQWLLSQLLPNLEIVDHEEDQSLTSILRKGGIQLN